MKRISFTVALIILLALLNGGVLAAEGIMPVSELKSGMKAIGKTVISGVKIEEFDVEILGVLKGQSQVGDLILVRVSGALIDKSGGIAAGMSGSPVYVDGKLIGAIGYSWSLTDHRFGLITPIETMLHVLELDKQSKDIEQSINIDDQSPRPGVKKPGTTGVKNTSQVDLSSPLILGSEVFTQVNFYASSEEAKNTITSGVIKAYPANTPLLVSGITGRAFERLKNDLKPFNLMPIEAGGTGSTDQKIDLQPGSAVAVQLVRGDINVSAIGTLTYRDNDSILAFGHPFTTRGQVQYYLSGAEILTVINSLDMPFKLGAAGEPKGVITQDRNAGIGGKLNIMPTIIPISVSVYDLNLNLEREVEFQVVRDEAMIVPLVIDSVLQSIDTVMDRQGYGTAKLGFQIVGDRLPGNLLEYSNMYYSGSDIAARSLSDFYNILDAVVNNPYESVNIGNIQIKVDVARSRQVAVLEEVKLLNQKLKAGDTAKIEVTLRPYRGEPFKQVYEIQIPKDMEPGEASITVSGGSYGGYVNSKGVESGENNGEENTSVIGEHYKSIEELLEDYLNQPRNNELVIEITPYYSESEGSEDTDNNDGGKNSAVKVSSENQLPTRGNYSGDTTEVNKNGNVQEIYQTGYVLEGTLTLEITIVEDVAQKPVESEKQSPKISILQIFKKKNIK